MRATFDNPTPHADRDLSRLHAKKIAEALRSKVQRERGVVIGDPTCDYKVPCHLPDFWCKAKVSETTVIFESRHKRGDGAAAPFFFTLTPWRNMATDTEIRAATPLIGKSVYRQHWVEEAPILAALRDRSVQAELRCVLAEGVTFLACSSAQLLAEFDSSIASESVRRVKSFQKLQLAFYELVRR
jgi:hypothetical protein